MNILRNIGFALWSVLMVVVGFAAYRWLDKPDLSVVNNYKKLKTKGDGNTVKNTANTYATQQTETNNTKKKFRFFSNKKRHK